MNKTSEPTTISLATNSSPRLTEAHRRELVEGSGLSDATIETAGVYSECNQTMLATILNRNKVDRSWLPALVFPYYDSQGAIVLRRVKPSNPPKDAKSGKEKKYLQPSKTPVRAFITRDVHAKLASNSCQTVLITEGEKKTLASNQAGFPCIGLSGVDCWHNKKSVSLIPDLHVIEWKSKQVFIAFDSDAVSNANVTRNERELAAALIDRGAKVKIIRIPPAKDGGKQGIDDFLVASGAEEFSKLLSQASPPEPPTKSVEKVKASESDPADDAILIYGGFKSLGEPTLRYWRGEWWQWKSGCYKKKDDGEIRLLVVRKLNVYLERVTMGFVSNVMEQLRALALISEDSEMPCWIGRADDASKEWSTTECLATKSRIIHLPSLTEASEEFDCPATPAFFSATASEVDLNLGSPEPAEWLGFLRSIWGDDPQCIDALQEWFGLLLLPDTSFQKLLLLVGPPRSGKGTIGRVLKSVVGSNNVVAPTMNSLTTNFGLSPLIGKSVAIISDARLSGRADQAVVVERILSITGEDPQTIDRKHLTPTTCKLPTRFVIFSNELPRFNDASGAIVSRMVLLEMRRSWLGKEDRTLEHRLKRELPGILLWAIDGWKRLQERGRLNQPESAYESLEELHDLASPVSTFLKDCCHVAEGLQTEKQQLFNRWLAWCERNGREKFAGTSSSFGRDLIAANPIIRARRVGPREERTQVYEGVGLR